MPAQNGAIELDWGDGTQTFNIAKLEQVFELQDKCGCGVMEVFERLRANRWRFEDVRETIRLALIGGGKTPTEALTLTRRYVDNRPWAESVVVAQTVLMAAIIGIPGDTPGKKPETDRAEEAASSMMMGGSSDLPSMV
jgi:hypothetical protein